MSRTHILQTKITESETSRHQF